MSLSEHNEFDDPQLRAALRRAEGELGGAPPELRDRVSALFAAPAVMPVHEYASRPTRPTWLAAVQYSLLAAACVGIAIGIAAVLVGFSPFPSSTFSSSNSVTPVNAVSPTLYADMVKTHDRCAKKADHHHIHVQHEDDFVEIGKALQTELNRPVVSASPGAEWTFRGAAICNVGTVRSAHLLFSHRDEQLSVFSLPLGYAACNSAETTDYEQTQDRHLIAGFAKSGALFCVVGYCPGGDLKMKDVVTLRDQLKSSVSASTCDHAIQSLALAR